MGYINFLELVYPINSIYLSLSDTSPALIIGGSWRKIEDAVLRLSSSDIGTYIGNDTHTLTVAEMPAHRHPLTWSYSTGGNGYGVLGGSAAIEDYIGGSVGGGNLTQLYKNLIMYMDGSALHKGANYGLC